MKKIEIREAVGCITGRVINHINPVLAEDQCTNALKAAKDYTFQQEKSLKENLIAYYTQRGYPQIEELSSAFSELVKGWLKKGDDLSVINIGMNVLVMAANRDIPQYLEIEE